MDFKITAKLEENCVSKKTGSTYNRVVLDFGKFKRILLLNDLELEVLKNTLKQNA